MIRLLVNPLAQPADALAVGARWTSGTLTIGEDEIVRFAMLTGDWFPIHTDRHAAAASPEGVRTAQGYLTLAIAAALLRPDPPGALIALRRLGRTRWIAPVPLGATLGVELEVAAVTVEGPCGGVATVRSDVRVLIAPERAVLVTELVTLQRCAAVVDRCDPTA